MSAESRGENAIREEWADRAGGIRASGRVDRHPDSDSGAISFCVRVSDVNSPDHKAERWCRELASQN